MRKAPKKLYSYGMGRGESPLLRWFSARFLNQVNYPEELRDKINVLNKEGCVVYVHRHRNIADFLALKNNILRYEMPLPAYVGGINIRMFQSWKRALLGMFTGVFRNRQKEIKALDLCVRNRLAAEVFLKKPHTFFSYKRAYNLDYIQELVEIQKEVEFPIFLLPHFLALNVRPPNAVKNTMDLIFGSIQAPGTIRAIWRLFFAKEAARFEISEAINLKEYINSNPHLESKLLATKVRRTILIHLARVERVTHGPPLKSAEHLMQDVLSDPILQTKMKEIAKEKGTDFESIKKEAGVIHKEIAAKPDVDLATAFDFVLKLIWKLIYKGLVFSKDDMDRIRQISRRGPLIIVPSHRSHVDYLVISQVFFWNALMPPLIAAGINLNFFPIGGLLRRTGAYFIRRTFKGDPLYPEIVKSYIRNLFKEGFTQEFFIEGGRSRNGKTLFPKMGILRFMLDAYVDSEEDDALFLPSYISYERVIEARSYAKELKGGEKEKESAAGFFRSFKVLRSKYGQVFVSFGDAISIKEFLNERGSSKTEFLSGTEAERRHLTNILAYKIVFEINLCTMITLPSMIATVMLGFRHRSLEEKELIYALVFLKKHIEQTTKGKAEFSHEFDSSREDFTKHVRIILAGRNYTMTSADEQVFYQNNPDACFELDFLKNTILHFLVADSIVASGMRALSATNGQTLLKSDIREYALHFSRILKFEFIFNGKDFDENFERVLQRAHDYKVLTIDGEKLSLNVAPEQIKWGSFAANLLSNLVDSYYSVFVNIVALLEEGPVKKKQLVQSLQEKLRVDFLRGVIYSPESISKINIENALTLLVDQQILTFKEQCYQMIENTEEPLSEMIAILKMGLRRK